MTVRITWLGLILLAGMSLLQAQPTTTTVSDTLYASDGSLAQGAVHIRLRTACIAPGGYVISALSTDTVFVTSGVFSKALVPNDTCVPSGTSYQINYDLTTAAGTPSARLPEIWVVPTSGSPVAISAIRVAVPPPVVPSFSISQLTGCSVAGQGPVYNGTAFTCQAITTNPMTSVGDLIRGGTAGAPARLAIGSANQFLGVSGGIPAWLGLADADIPNLSGLSTGLTASRAIVTDGSSLLAASSVTATELGYMSGVTSAVQTQMDGKQPLDSDLTAIAALAPSRGAIIRRGVSAWEAHALGGANTVLASDGTDAAFTALGDAHIPNLNVLGSGLSVNVMPRIDSSGFLAASKCTITVSPVTLTCYDDTVTTGRTQLKLQANAAQTVTDLLQIIEPSGELGAGIDTYGGFFVKDRNPGANKKKFAFSAALAGIGSADFTSDSILRWKSVNDLDAVGSYDLGLARPAAGVLDITNGSGTKYFIFDGPNLRLSAGGTSASFPAWQRNGAAWDSLLADGSGYAQVNIAPGGKAKACTTYTIAESALTDADTEEDEALFTLAAGGRIDGVTVKHSAAFTGGGLTAMTVSVGTAAAPTEFTVGTFDIFQAVGDTVKLDSGYWGSPTNASVGIIARFTSTSANVSAATAGSVDIEVCHVNP